MAKSKRILTPRFRVSYAHIFKPQDNDDGSKVYSVTMIFDPSEDLSEMRALVKETKEIKWGNRKPTGKSEPTFRKGTQYDEEENPNGYDLKKNPEYKGMIICTAKSYGQAVNVVKVNKSKPKGDPKRLITITDPSEFYSGCYAKASVTTYAYEKRGKNGVSFGLQNLIKVGDGEPLVKYANPHDDFGEMDDDEFDEDYLTDEDTDNDDDLDDLDDL